MIFKEFDDDDWQGMAGATSFTLGEAKLEPLVAYDMHVDGLPAMAVIDAEVGLGIQVYTPDGEDVAYFFPSSPQLGQRWLALQEHTATDLTTTGLLAAGFVEERDNG